MDFRQVPTDPKTRGAGRKVKQHKTACNTKVKVIYTSAAWGVALVQVNVQ